MCDLRGSGSGECVQVCTYVSVRVHVVCRVMTIIFTIGLILRDGAGARRPRDAARLHLVRARPAVRLHLLVQAQAVARGPASASRCECEWPPSPEGRDGAGGRASVVMCRAPKGQAVRATGPRRRQGSVSRPQNANRIALAGPRRPARPALRTAPLANGPRCALPPGAPSRALRCVLECGRGGAGRSLCVHSHTCNMMMNRGCQTRRTCPA